MLFSTLNGALLLYGLASLITYYLLKVICRVYLHPLRSFPGPRLAAATYWYEAYYDIFKDSKGLQFPEHIQSLHRQYGKTGHYSFCNGTLTQAGPIVRINPNELHTNDAEAYSTIHSLKTQWYKDPQTYYPFHASHSTFGAISNSEHKARRKLLSPSFSRQSVLDTETLIRNEAQALASRVQAASIQDKPVNARTLFRAYAADIIMKIAMDRSPKYIEAGNMGQDFFEAIDLAARSAVVFRNFQWLCPIVFNMPDFINERIAGAMYPLVEFQHSVENQVQAEIETHDAQVKGHDQGREDPSTKSKTIFARLLENLPRQANHRHRDAVNRLIDEGTTVLGAAVETVETTLTTTLRSVLANPGIYERLHDELASAFNSNDKHDSTVDPTMLELEKLPYLTAALKEGLRLAWGIPARLGRVSPTDVVLCGRRVPAGTCVSTIPALVNLNPDIWGDDAECFNPERWLSEDKADDRYLASFSKGARGCLGINLAWAELYYAIALLVLRFPQLESAGAMGVQEPAKGKVRTDVCRDVDAQLHIIDREVSNQGRPDTLSHKRDQS